MRVTTWFLIAAGIFLLVLAGIMTMRAQRFGREAVVSKGTVKALTAGPLHAMVQVTTTNGRTFEFDTSSSSPMVVGQIIPVRYLSINPDQTAELATDSVYAMPRDMAITGIVMILAALISPFLVRRFPNLLTYAIRP